MNKKTNFEAEDDRRLSIKHTNTVRVAEQKLVKLLLLAKMFITARVKGLLHFNSDPNLGTKGCVPAKGIFIAISNRLYFILVTNTSIK